MRIIKVEELNGWGFSSNTKYFSSLNKAKRYFKYLIKNHKSDLVEDEECSYQEKPIIYDNESVLSICTKSLRRKRANLECWYSSDTEYETEWNTHPITITLDEIVLE